jgi:hypothetical protein
LGRGELHCGGITLHPLGDPLVAADEDAISAGPAWVIRPGIASSKVNTASLPRHRPQDRWH